MNISVQTPQHCYQYFEDVTKHPKLGFYFSNQKPSTELYEIPAASAPAAANISHRYIKHYVVMGIVVVVCGKMCGKICGKIETMLDWNTNWCGSRY